MPTMLEQQDDLSACHSHDKIKQDFLTPAQWAPTLKIRDACC